MVSLFTLPLQSCGLVAISQHPLHTTSNEEASSFKFKRRLIIIEDNDIETNRLEEMRQYQRLVGGWKRMQPNSGVGRL